MNEWMQDKAVREGSEGSLVDVMILEQLAGQHRWRGEWVLLGFVSWRHLLLVQPECQKVFSELSCGRLVAKETYVGLISPVGG